MNIIINNAYYIVWQYKCAQTQYLLINKQRGTSELLTNYLMEEAGGEGDLHKSLYMYSILYVGQLGDIIVTVGDNINYIISITQIHRIAISFNFTEYLTWVNLY